MAFLVKKSLNQSIDSMDCGWLGDERPFRQQLFQYKQRRVWGVWTHIHMHPDENAWKIQKDGIEGRAAAAGSDLSQKACGNPEMRWTLIAARPFVWEGSAPATQLQLEAHSSSSWDWLRSAPRNLMVEQLSTKSDQISGSIRSALFEPHPLKGLWHHLLGLPSAIALFRQLPSRSSLVPRPIFLDPREDHPNVVLG